MPHSPSEGVIRFAVAHTTRALEPRVLGEAAGVLGAWREILAHLRVLGQDPARYEGLGFGNVSIRVAPLGGAPQGARPFLVTGTQTGALAHTTLREFCLVERWDIPRNAVTSRGEVAPSSESLTHAALYDCSPAVRVVLHAHAPAIWRRARALGLPVSDPGAANGTPAMAFEMQRLYREGVFASLRVAAMGGHEDGIVAFGATAEEAGGALVRELARALANAPSPARPEGRS
ncbi:MAG: class II aldolase/adducin family protein [Candidatus Eisenbacteria bacterium]